MYLLFTVYGAGRMDLDGGNRKRIILGLNKSVCWFLIMVSFYLTNISLHSFVNMFFVSIVRSVYGIIVCT